MLVNIKHAGQKKRKRKKRKNAVMTKSDHKHIEKYYTQKKKKLKY